MTVSLATKKIRATAVRPGTVLAMVEGDFTVKSVGYGDPDIHGFVKLDGRIAAPWVVTFECGTEVVMHPRHNVTSKML